MFIYQNWFPDTLLEIQGLISGPVIWCFENCCYVSLRTHQHWCISIYALEEAGAVEVQSRLRTVRQHQCKVRSRGKGHYLNRGTTWGGSQEGHNFGYPLARAPYPMEGTARNVCLVWMNFWKQNVSSLKHKISTLLLWKPWGWVLPNPLRNLW